MGYSALGVALGQSSAYRFDSIHSSCAGVDGQSTVDGFLYGSWPLRVSPLFFLSVLAFYFMHEAGAALAKLTGDIFASSKGRVVYPR